MEQTTYQEQARNTFVTPDVKLGILVMQAKYDKVWKKNKDGSIVQAFADLPNVSDDLEESLKALRFIGVDDFGPDDSYILNKDLDDTDKSITLRMYMDMNHAIDKRLKKDPDKMHLVFQPVAGHGMIFEGTQWLLLNQYDKFGQFYKLLAIETLTRMRTLKHTNCYEIVLVACCREIKSLKRHTGCVGANSKEEAEIAFKVLKIAEDQNLTKKEHEELLQQELEIYEQSQQKTRGTGLISIPEVQNFFIVVGAEPGRGVAADTKLIRDAFRNFLEQYDKKTLTVLFPKILQNLKGSDAKIEIMQSTMLQPILIPVRGNRPVKPKAFVFVNQYLQRGDLPKIEYTNAEERAQAHIRFFTDLLECDKEDVNLCRDYSKAQILDLLSQQQKDAEAFEKDEKHGPNDVNLVYFSWIGFILDSHCHGYMDQLDISEKLLPSRFPITVRGEPFAVVDHSLNISKHSKTQVIVMLDDQESTKRKPRDKAYIDQDAGFNDFIFKEQVKDISWKEAMPRFHFFCQSDMAGNILPTLLKMKSDGKHVFPMPATLQNLDVYQSVNGVTPSTVFHDTRSDKRRQADEKGLPSASLNESLTPYQIRPTIQTCELMGKITKPTIWHAEYLRLIVMVYRDPKERNQTLIKMFDDSGPFDLKDQAVVEYPTYYATHSYDRRSQIEQINDKQLIIGLSDFGNYESNMIVKIMLDDKLKCKGEVIESEVLAVKFVFV